MGQLTSIFLAGASRGVGREVAQRLVAPEFKVTALLRSTAAQAELEALGVKIVLGDALHLETVTQAMQQFPPQVVISTLGGRPQSGQRADFWGSKHLIDAARTLGVQKFILVSSIGAGDSVVALAPSVLQVLQPVLIEKEKAEQYLIESGLTYTIVRPGGLKSAPATGNAILTENVTVSGLIHRADVAELVCQCLRSDRVNNRVLSALDPTLSSPTPVVEAFSLF